MRAHTVILGAGATMAAIPNGDRNGSSSSVMSGMLQKLNLSDLLIDVKLETTSDNLEDIYSELFLKPEYRNIIVELEERLYSYFESLELPDEPTIYDSLVLSLTCKDVIATFNWDPLLLQAYVRCHRITDNLPHILCLHGNVGIGYCEQHEEFGIKGAVCPVCRKNLPSIKLLYPVKNKNYKESKYIKDSWDAVEYMIENSYMLTIFGYSSPSSDTGAVRLLKKAWGELDNRQLEEVSIIDIADESDILKKWDDFIYSHHYRYTNNFFESYLGMFPRRSCETVFATFSFNIFADGSKGFKDGMSWAEINTFVDNLLEDERKTPPDKNLPLYYTAKGFIDR